MSTKTMRISMALGAGGAIIAGAVAIATASQSWAAPIPANTAALRTAASSQVTDVYYYRHRHYRHRHYRHRYYPYRYYRRSYYGRGYYGYGYPYYYSYPYAYPYSYSYPFPFGYGWGWW
jgi:hypothetical protein